MRISETQLQMVDTQIKRLLKADNFYGRKLKEQGITGVRTEEEFRSPG